MWHPKYLLAVLCLLALFSSSFSQSSEEHTARDVHVSYEVREEQESLYDTTRTTSKTLKTQHQISIRDNVPVIERFVIPRFNYCPVKEICPPSSTELCGKTRPAIDEEDSNYRAMLSDFIATQSDVHFMTSVYPGASDLLDKVPTGIALRLSVPLLLSPVTGSRPYSPRWAKGSDEIGEADTGSRGHIWFKLIRGPGNLWNNILMLFKKANKAQTAMECDVKNAPFILSLAQSDKVFYSVFPHYHDARESPDRVIMYADVKYKYYVGGLWDFRYAAEPWMGYYVSNTDSATLLQLYNRTNNILDTKNGFSINEPITEVTRKAPRSLDFYPSMSFPSNMWRTVIDTNGPSLIPKKAQILFDSTSQTVRNKKARLISQELVNIKHGSSFRFRIWLRQTNSKEVKIALPGGLIIRIINSGAKVQYSTYDNGFNVLANSPNIANNNWIDLYLVYQKDEIVLWEQGEKILMLGNQDFDDTMLFYMFFQNLEEDTKTQVYVTNIMIHEELFR